MIDVVFGLCVCELPRSGSNYTCAMRPCKIVCGKEQTFAGRAVASVAVRQHANPRSRSGSACAGPAAEQAPPIACAPQLPTLCLQSRDFDFATTYKVTDCAAHRPSLHADAGVAPFVRFRFLLFRLVARVSGTTSWSSWPVDARGNRGSHVCLTFTRGHQTCALPTGFEHAGRRMPPEQAKLRQWRLRCL